MSVMNYLTTCIFDHGAVARIGESIKRLGISKPFIVTDPNIRSMGLLDILIEYMPENYIVFWETQSNPTEHQAITTTKIYNNNSCDGIVALGGGSTIDHAKNIGLIATHEAPIEQYGATVGGTSKIGPIPPLVAIPTTAGTGSEVSIGTVVTLDNGKKETIVSPHLIPSIAICDPELTVDLPRHLTAATGMDAVTHCIESILSPRIHPPAESIGFDGLQRAIGNGCLKRAFEDGYDKDARWNMMMASYEGALAFVKGLGGVHALSHAAGRLKELKLHHGTLNAIWLPHLLAHNQGVDDYKYAKLREAIKLPPNADLPQAIADLNDSLGIPKTLKEVGIDSGHGPGIVTFALKDLAHHTNIRTLKRSDYELLFEAALG